MVHNYVRLCVRPKTKTEFLKCKDEFLKHHPEFESFKEDITEDKLLEIIVDYYLGR